MLKRMNFRRRAFLLGSLFVLLSITACVLVEVVLAPSDAATSASLLQQAAMEGKSCWHLNPAFYTYVGHDEDVTGISWEARGFLLSPEKEKHTIRIAVFGESAAIGNPTDSAYGFWRILKVLLEKRFPEYGFEFLPLAHPGVDSYCMYAAAQQITPLKPDFFLIYLGNNEVTGPHGSTNSLLNTFDSVWPVRLHDKLTASRTMRLAFAFADMAEGILRAGRGVDQQELLERMAQSPPQSPERQACIRRFRENLRDICQIALDHNAKALVSTMAANLRSWEPFFSAHREGWNSDLENEWQRLADAARQEENRGAYAAAITTYEKALALDAQYADTHFRLATCLHATGRFEEALSHFSKARDFDRLQARSTSAINNAIRDTVTEFATPEIQLVEGELALNQNSPGGVAGWEMFYDPIHFQFQGAFQLALAFADAISQNLAPDTTFPEDEDLFDHCKAALAFTPEVDLKHLEIFEKDMLNGLREALGKQWHVAEVAQKRTKLIEAIGLRPPNAVEIAYRAALTINPDDAVLRERCIDLLRGGGKKSEADALEEQCPESAKPTLRFLLSKKE